MAVCDDFIFTDAILGKKWHYQEVQQLLVSQLAVMPGKDLFPCDMLLFVV